MRLNPHFDAQLASGGVQPNLLVDKSRKMLNLVQNRLNFQLHCWPLVSSLHRSSHRSETQRSALFFRLQLAGLHPIQHQPAPSYSQERASGGNELSNSKFALPPVATRNGLASLLRIGAPTNMRKH
jgi:hypothetical protein